MQDEPNHAASPSVAAAPRVPGRRRKALRRTALGMGACLVVLLVAALLVPVASDRKRHRVVQVDAPSVPYVEGPAAVERGRYLFVSRGCAECHGADGAGRVFIDAPNGLRVRSTNLTRGAGGAVDRYSERDWVRAIRHGVDPSGRPLFAMPSEDFNRLTDADLADLVSYVRALGPVSAPAAEVRLPWIVEAAYAAGVVRDAAEKIDHALPPSAPVPVAVSAAHGRYVANACIGCHGANLEGGRIPGTPPDWPPSARLAPGEGSVVPGYTTPSQFKALMRDGVRPDGTKVSSVMPIESLRHMTDTDIEAMYVFLKSMPSPGVAKSRN